MYQLRYSAQAKDDLIAIKKYITTEGGSATVALQFTGKLRERCRKLAALQSKMGRERPELGGNIRSFPHGNYVIFFMYNSNRLDVVTITEGHRDIEALFHPQDP